MAQKAISDEQIIAALLTHGTIKEAAAAVDLSERALYDRMNTGEFQELYKAAKADLLRSAVLRLNSHLLKAIDTTAELMDSNGGVVKPAIRLQAAQTILNSACKFASRLQDTENSTIAQAESNRFGLW